MEDPTLWVYKENKYDPKKHESERVKNGFSTEDWFGFSDYLAWVIIQGLIKFRDEGAGYPAALETGEAGWNDILNEMITGFEAHQAMEQLTLRSCRHDWEEYVAEAERLRAVRRRGLDLFAEYFEHLWD